MAVRRGFSMRAGSSSALKMRTLPSGRSFDQGTLLRVVTAAHTAAQKLDLPRPGSPSSIVNVPRGRYGFNSQGTASATTSDIVPNASSTGSAYLAMLLAMLATSSSSRGVAQTSAFTASSALSMVA